MNLFDTELDEEVDVLEKEDLEKKLVVYNDDFNTFEHVIMCLINYCEHTPEKANEHTLNIHQKGLAIVKEGTLKELLPIKQALNENGLTVKIEE